MKKRWETKKIDEVCQFINGLWKGEEPPFINIGVFRNTNFTKDGNLDDTDIAYLDVELKKFEKRQLMYGDIILEKSGGGPKQPVGRVALFDKKKGRFSFSNFTAAMRVNDPKILDFRFLHKFLFWTHLSGATENMQNHSTGIRNLNSSAYKNIELPLPPLPEQRRIVGILDEAFDAIAKAKANAEKNLQNARELFESQLNEVFSKRDEGWVEKNLGDVCDFRGGGTPSKAVKRYWKGRIPWVSPKDMKFDVVSDSIDHISTEAIEDSATSLIPKGAVLIVVRSGILARIVPIAITGRELTINQDIKALCPNNMVETRFLYDLLESKMPILLSMVSRGATVHRLMTEQIRSLRFPLPPKAEQRRIVGLVTLIRIETQRLESIYQRKLTTLDELKKSLLQQAFSGNL